MIFIFPTESVVGYLSKINIQSNERSIDFLNRINRNHEYLNYKSKSIIRKLLSRILVFIANKSVMIVSRDITIMAVGKKKVDE